METLLECGHVESPHSEFTRGYGTDAEGNRHCYACCAERDKAQMRKEGRITLYLTMEKVGSVGMCWHEGKPAVMFSTRNGRQKYLAKVTNWPGSLCINVYGGKIGRHNIAGNRYDVWFTFEGSVWHGVQYGDNTQICHCKRTKQ